LDQAMNSYLLTTADRRPQTLTQFDAADDHSALALGRELFLQLAVSSAVVWSGADGQALASIEGALGQVRAVR
jgi:hypothetical protein